RERVLAVSRASPTTADTKLLLAHPPPVNGRRVRKSRNRLEQRVDASAVISAALRAEADDVPGQGTQNIEQLAPALVVEPARRALVEREVPGALPAREPELVHRSLRVEHDAGAA